MKNIKMILIGILFICFFSSCKKYLDLKPLQTMVVPQTTADLQALLDNNVFMNVQTPDIAEALSDDYYIETSTYQTLSGNDVYFDDITNYIWDKNAMSLDSWRVPYEGPIYYSNIVLDYIGSIPANESDKEQLTGSALFYRSFAFNQLAQIYCRPYSSDAVTDLGIVLRLSSNINVISKRSTVQETYAQIISDLNKAAILLPEKTPFTTRPNKAAALGLLARVYLEMRDYKNAGKLADSCLKKNSTILDYNTLFPIKNPPIQWTNPEVIYFNQAYTSLGALWGATYGRIDSILYQSYETNDLRKTILFKSNTGSSAGTYAFNGSYTSGFKSGSNFDGIFDGLASDEILLIRAECFARAGNVGSAMNDLNALLIKRYKSGTFTPLTAANPDEAVNKILTERRKELLYRTLRWSDLRRLNIDGANITLTRNINNVIYTLPPNDPRWILLIPSEVINRSNIQQNPR